MSFDPEGPAAAGSGIFGLPHTLDEASLVLIPVPFDATTSYGRRARLGPQAIFEASHQVDLFDVHTGRPYEAGIAMLPMPAHVEAWNREATELVDACRDADDSPQARAKRVRVDALGEELNQWLYEETRRWLGRGKRVGLIGGDHATPYGHIRAHVERYPDLGVLHVDAHADLRDAYEGFTWSHASIMFNVRERLPVKKLVHVGLRDVAETEVRLIRESGGRHVGFFDHEIADHRLSGHPFKALLERVVAALPREVYVSFDIDGLDPALCPNTGTPVPGGLAWHEAIALLGAVRASGRTIVGFDLNEVAPGDDGDEWDGNVGARLLYKLCGFTLARD